MMVELPHGCTTPHPGWSPMRGFLMAVWVVLLTSPTMGDKNSTPYFGRPPFGGSVPRGSLTQEVLVAASDAPASVRALADYVCDGARDEEQINEAISSLPPTGGGIRLSRGTFYVDAGPIRVTRCQVSIHGENVGSTTIRIRPGYQGHAMFWYQYTGAGRGWLRISDMCLEGGKPTVSSGLDAFVDSVADVEGVTESNTSDGGTLHVVIPVNATPPWTMTWYRDPERTKAVAEVTFSGAGYYPLTPLNDSGIGGYIWVKAPGPTTGSDISGTISGAWNASGLMQTLTGAAVGTDGNRFIGQSNITDGSVIVPNWVTHALHKGSKVRPQSDYPLFDERPIQDVTDTSIVLSEGPNVSRRIWYVVTQNASIDVDGYAILAEVSSDNSVRIKREEAFTYASKGLTTVALISPAGSIVGTFTVIDVDAHAGVWTLDGNHGLSAGETVAVRFGACHSDTHIEHCLLRGFAKCGVITTNPRGMHLQDTIIESCGKDGVLATGTEPGTGLLIDRCRITSNLRHGVHLTHPIGGASITNSDLGGGYGAGVFLSSSDHNSIVGNRFETPPTSRVNHAGVLLRPNPGMDGPGGTRIVGNHFVDSADVLPQTATSVLVDADGYISSPTLWSSLSRARVGSILEVAGPTADWYELYIFDVDGSNRSVARIRRCEDLSFHPAGTITLVMPSYGVASYSHSSSTRSILGNNIFRFSRNADDVPLLDKKAASLQAENNSYDDGESHIEDLVVRRIRVTIPATVTGKGELTITTAMPSEAGHTMQGDSPSAVVGLLPLVTPANDKAALAGWYIHRVSSHSVTLRSANDVTIGDDHLLYIGLRRASFQSGQAISGVTVTPITP